MRPRISDATAKALAEYQALARKVRADNRRWAREARASRPKLTAEQIATLIVRSLRGVK